MKIALRPKQPRNGANNVVAASSREFANLIRQLETRGHFNQIEGSFAIFRNENGPVVIELNSKWGVLEPHSCYPLKLSRVLATSTSPI
ncbi:MAG: hypothetical protein JSW61_11000 [Candidatus Thorarchaeota archaeon]|nr:MAG: hypothetical protein JSW61_11000 [Candidatus Thorarchaeota archaeon]